MNVATTNVFLAQMVAVGFWRPPEQGVVFNYRGVFENSFFTEIEGF